jgi:hypothetical protein
MGIEAMKEISSKNVIAAWEESMKDSFTKANEFRRKNGFPWINEKEHKRNLPLYIETSFGGVHYNWASDGLLIVKNEDKHFLRTDRNDEFSWKEVSVSEAGEKILNSFIGYYDFW